MQHFPQFHTVRRIQHIRETKLVELMQYIDPIFKSNFTKIISTMASIYTTQLKNSATTL